MVNIYTLSIVFSIIFLLVVIELVRRGKLHEKYSLLWIVFALIIVVLSMSRSLIEDIAAVLDIKYAPSVLFLLGFLYLLIYSLHITTVLSRHADRIVRLAQEISLLRQKLELKGTGIDDLA